MSLDAIGVVCLDVDKMISFYKHLGLSFTEYGEGHFEAQTNSGVRLMFDSIELVKKFSPHWIQSSGSNTILCFKQNDTGHVDGLYLKLISNGATSVKEPWNAFWGQRYATVKDPEGNFIDLFCDLNRGE